MLHRLTKWGVSAAILLLVTSAAVPSPQEGGKKKEYKDRQEYDIIKKVYETKEPRQRLQLLDQWKEKYPETDFELERKRFYFASYQATQQTEKAVEAAKTLLEAAPNAFQPTYYIASTAPFRGSTSPEVLNDGERAAKALLNGLIEKQFDAKNKPQNVSSAQWEEAHQQALLNAHQTLGWVAMQRKNHVEAEEQFKEVLKIDPKMAQVSYWLGQVVLGQGKPQKNELALFSFARAAVYDGQGSLQPQGRQQVDQYLTKVYTKYTGTEDGLAELKNLAQRSALPPDDLVIESKSVRAYKAEQKSRRENPKLWVFKDLKKALLGPQGDSTWSELRGTLTPEMRLYAVSASPPDRPKTIRLTSEQGGSVEVVLNLENRLRTGVRSGSWITFEGVATSLNKSPFRLTLEDGKVLGR